MSRWPLTIRGTGALLLSFGCFVAAHAFTIIELLYVSALLTVAVLASVATLYVVRSTARVTRSFSPDVARVGGEVEVRLLVEIRSPLPGAQGRWRDAMPDGVSGDAAGVFPETSSGMRSAGQAVRLDYSLLAQQRGIRAIGPVSVVSTDPFGFARRRHTIGRALPLTIAPATVDLGPLAEQPGATGGSMHTATDQLGQGTDNLVPRHYVPGDSMRRIHWRSSAHRDQLMVRQEEQETTPEAIVVLDLSAEHWDDEAARTPGVDAEFEIAVSACISATARLVHEGYLVSVLDADGTMLTDPIEGGDGAAAEQFAAELATVTAHRSSISGPRTSTPSASEALVALFSGAMTGPLVYVTGAITETDAAALARLAHHSTLPLLLAVAPRGDALSRAASAGWRTVTIPPGTDLAAAWGAVADRGARRVDA